jgi:hypothetical protein
MKPHTRNPDAWAVLDDPETYANTQARFEAGERQSLADSLGVSVTTVYRWAKEFAWPHLRRREWLEERKAKALEMIAAGYSTHAIREATGMAQTTIDDMRDPEDRERRRQAWTSTRAAKPGPAPATRPAGHVGGWFCSSNGCTWWGADVVAYKAHKKMHEEVADAESESRHPRRAPRKAA